MSALGFVPSQTAPEPTAPANLRLRILASLAGPGGIWLRGQLLGLVPGNGARSSSWWAPWRGRETPAPPPAVTLGTQVAGHCLSAFVPVDPLGQVDATFDTQLPPARRGWRIARNQITYQGAKAEACSVLLSPASDATGVRIVVLPRSETQERRSGQPFAADSPAGLALAPLAGTLRKDAERRFLCYLACVPAAGEACQAELALALNALGWPHGHIILLPATPENAERTVAGALERIRGLFAGTHEVQVIDCASPEGTALDAQPMKAAREEAASSLPGPRNGLRPTRSGLVPRHPIVFCHGMLACSMLRMQLRPDYNYFAPLQRFFEERGFRVLFPRVAPTGGVVERAVMLRELIRRWTDEPVNLVAHSMGGLDARYLISHLHMAERVKTLTTISTPHRGTFMADWFRENFRQRVPLLIALEAMGISVEGFNDCRPSVCREFNARTPDDPRVRYFSYAGNVPLHRVTPMLRRAWDLLTPVEGLNDGLVSVRSARWGEHLGTIYADHFAQTPDGLFVHPQESFDSLGFFTRIVEDLARRGY